MKISSANKLATASSALALTLTVGTSIYEAVTDNRIADLDGVPRVKLLKKQGNTLEVLKEVSEFAQVAVVVTYANAIVSKLKTD